MWVRGPTLGVEGELIEVATERGDGTVLFEVLQDLPDDLGGGVALFGHDNLRRPGQDAPIALSACVVNEQSPDSNIVQFGLPGVVREGHAAATAEHEERGEVVVVGSVVVADFHESVSLFSRAARVNLWSLVGMGWVVINKGFLPGT